MTVWSMQLTERERDAVLAGLRLLQCGLLKRRGYYPVDHNDEDVGAILTNCGKHEGMSVEEIDALIEERVNV